MEENSLGIVCLKSFLRELIESERPSRAGRSDARKSRVLCGVGSKDCLSGSNLDGIKLTLNTQSSTTELTPPPLIFTARLGTKYQLSIV